jgi:hypothetical protein
MHKFFDDTMKRLLRISFDSFIISFIPIIAWFMLGLTVDSNLINVFTITYPIQFIWSMYTVKTVYLQINYSAVEITSNKTLSNIIRFILSLLKTPYCTAIGELTSALYQTITVSFIFNKHFKVNKKGEVTTK